MALGLGILTLWSCGFALGSPCGDAVFRLGQLEAFWHGGAAKLQGKRQTYDSTHVGYDSSSESEGPAMISSAPSAGERTMECVRWDLEVGSRERNGCALSGDVLYGKTRPPLNASLARPKAVALYDCRPLSTAKWISISAQRIGVTALMLCVFAGAPSVFVPGERQLRQVEVRSDWQGSPHPQISGRIVELDKWLGAACNR
ncbi:MAG: hypothetical protein SGPRY_013379, partial [Prymnesium sp.]